MSRPARLTVVAGTGTGVGKTWVTARLAEHLVARGVRVVARKPAQSFEPGHGPTDAEVLGQATGEDPRDVCPPHRWYEVAMAPFMAADSLGRAPFTLPELAGEVRWPEMVDVGLVEAAGGVRSPITSDGGDTVDLAAALHADLVVLVADAGLGTINAVRLSADALAGLPTVIFLNRYDRADDLNRRNRAWLAAHLSTPVTTSTIDLANLVAPS